MCLINFENMYYSIVNIKSLTNEDQEEQIILHVLYNFVHAQAVV